MTFKLKNAHKYRALERAVLLINKNLGKSLLDQRESLVDDVKFNLLQILTPATDNPLNADFIHEGVAKNVETVNLNGYWPTFFGLPRFAASPLSRLIEQAEQHHDVPSIIVMGNSDGSPMPLTLALPRPVISFKVNRPYTPPDILNTADADIRLPNGDLYSALYLKTKDSTVQTAQYALRANLVEITRIAKELVALHVNIRAIILDVAACITDDDLYAIFPAARGMFPDENERRDHATSSEGTSLLRTLSV